MLFLEFPAGAVAIYWATWIISYVFQSHPYIDCYNFQLAIDTYSLCSIRFGFDSSFQLPAVRLVPFIDHPSILLRKLIPDRVISNFQYWLLNWAIKVIKKFISYMCMDIII